MNRLQYETSPYLLQHAENPVDWYPWGEEALQKARSEDKPILLSVGYSACHWCHVMAHESFEDPASAAMMNDYFVNIKVDREERPDLDDIYMKAAQVFQQGRGGWPMTVFLTPQGKPFHAGTYYPLIPRYGMPSLQQVMQAVKDAYDQRRDEVEQTAAQVAEMLQSEGLCLNLTPSLFTEALLEQSALKLISRADMRYGGLHSDAPKFPSPMNLEYLLRYAAHSKDKRVLNVVCFTLEQMAKGGIYDQVGFGFARYSVDEQWLVPHFEKMLYDNAQLARVYLHAYQLTRDEFFARICNEVLTYTEREMLNPNGGFYSTLDADSEGEEGKFYVWSVAEFEEALADTFDEDTIKALRSYWDVTPGGNFEGHNILHVDREVGEVAFDFGLDEDELEASIEIGRGRLFAVRQGRIKPGLDDKMLAAWNGMMLAAYAEAARVFPEQRQHYLQIAQRNADFLLTTLSTPDGRLYRTHKTGHSKLNGYLEDYTCVIDGLLELYQSDFDPRWFKEAQRLADHVLAHFMGDDGGGFYDTSDDHEALVARPRSLQDNATPSGNNLMAFNLMRLFAYTGNAAYEDAALTVFGQVLAAVQQYPSAFGVALSAMDLYVRRPVEVAIIGPADQARPLLDLLQGDFRPRLITALSPADTNDTAIPPLLAGRTQREGQPTVYVCQNFACAAPVTSLTDLEKLL
jgi:hypothetical protein